MEVIERNKNSLDVIWHKHPMLVADRERYSCIVGDESTVRKILIDQGIDPKQPIVIMLDGRMLTVDEWDSVRPMPGQIINVKACVSGDDFNPARALATVAVMYVAYQFGGYIGAEYGTVWGAVASATVMMGGSMLINSLLPAYIPSSSLSLSGLSGQYSNASPTYSLSGGSNRMRPYEVMPIVMGAHRFSPDIVSKPYTDYSTSNTATLYQIFGMGLSECEFSNWKIGGNPIENYTGVTFYRTYARYGSDGSGQLSFEGQNFPGNVDSIKGDALTHDKGWVVRSTSEDTYRIQIEIESVLYRSNDSGGLDRTSVSISVQYKHSDDTEWLTPPDDWGFIGGKIDLAGDSQNVIRLTYNLFVKDRPGKYDVRVRRDTADSFNVRLQNKTNFSQLKSWQLDKGNYNWQNRVGISIDASSQLNGTLSQVTVDASALAEYWNGSSWVRGKTSNPAHWFMYVSRGHFSYISPVDSDEQIKLFGVGLSDEQIDLECLHAWSLFCKDEGLTFDAVIDRPINVHDLLSAIARCGFASISWPRGKLGVVWDARNAPPVSAFGMSNILQGSFSIAYATENLAEEIIVRYENPENDWNQDEVRVLVPGVTNPQRTSSIELFGCTNKVMAGKFANRMAAQQYYRRRMISWDCDSEGFSCNRGDVVLLSHDLTQWGYSGRIVSRSGRAGRTLTLDRSVPRSGVVEYLMLKRPDGQMETYEVLASSGESDVVTLSTDPLFQEGFFDMDHIWMFSPLPTPGKLVKIISVSPKSETRMSIVATDECEEFYEAWDGTFNEAPTSTLLTSSDPSISGIRLYEHLYKKSTGIVSNVTISFDVSGSYDHSNIRYAIGNGNWLTDKIYGSSYTFDARTTGVVYIEITPFSGIRSGETKYFSQKIFGVTLPPANVSNFTYIIGSNGVELIFDKCPDVDWSYTQIRQGETWDLSTHVTNISAESFTLGWIPAVKTTFLAKHVDTSGNFSSVATAIELDLKLIKRVIKITKVDVNYNTVDIAWDSPAGTYPIVEYRIYDSSTIAPRPIQTLDGNATSTSITYPADRLVYFNIVAIDASGRRTDPSVFSAALTYPDGWYLSNIYDENWSIGTVVNGHVDSGSLYLPVNTESFEDHFSSRGYSTIQDQINAGYDKYFQPSELSGSYVESHDLGYVVSSARVYITTTSLTLFGSVTPSIRLETSLDGITWNSSLYGNVPNGYQRKNFRYVRVTYSVTALGGDDLVRLDRISIQVKNDTKIEVATLSLDHTDAGGTEYICKTAFSDIISVIATPLNSGSINRVNVIISDSTSPQKIYVQAWDISNNRISGTVSLSIGGN